MRRQGRFARRRKSQTACINRPRLRIRTVEIDGRHSNDLVVLDIDEDRATIGHIAIAHRSIRHRRSKFPAGGLAHHQGLGKPVCQVLRTVDAQRKVLL